MVSGVVMFNRADIDVMSVAVRLVSPHSYGVMRWNNHIDASAMVI